MGGGLPPGHGQEGKAQGHRGGEYPRGRRCCGPPGQAAHVRRLPGRADDRFAVPLIGGVQPPGRRQGGSQDGLHGQPARQGARKDGGAGDDHRAGQQPQADLARRSAQAGENGHRVPLPPHKQVAEQQQHRQRPPQAGRRDGQGGGPHGLEGLGGGGVALVVQGDPHPLRGQGLEGVGGLTGPGVVQHRPAQLIAEERLAEAALGGGYPQAAVIVRRRVGDAHHLQDPAGPALCQGEAVICPGGQDARLHPVPQG